MTVDDHAVNTMRAYYDASYLELKKEWISGKYERLSECPSFKETHTFREAMKILIHGPEQADDSELKKLINEEVELENFWKERRK